ncbi:MAG: alpha/beta hydrolase [Clostridia bacterium]|nr:alpha/beta hydrolase [Clostridia bacterium]
MDAVIYIHGQNGSASEAEHYKPLFENAHIFGVEYCGVTPWEAGEEIHRYVADIASEYDRIILIANSIGAYYSMCADIEKFISRAYFISPIVDMEKLITDMMTRADVTERELCEKGKIVTASGDVLSWKYLCYARKNHTSWSVPTDILYAGKDSFTSRETIASFAKEHRASLTVMDNGEHWFHTDAQMKFLDGWIREKSDS